MGELSIVSFSRINKTRAESRCPSVDDEERGNTGFRLSYSDVCYESFNVYMIPFSRRTFCQFHAEESASSSVWTAFQPST